MLTYLTAGNPPVVQVKLISICLDSLLGFGELKFPLVLTIFLVPVTPVLPCELCYFDSHFYHLYSTFHHGLQIFKHGGWPRGAEVLCELALFVCFCQLDTS